MAALLFLAAGDSEGELSSLKGRDEALRTAQIGKNCANVPATAAADAPAMRNAEALLEGATYASFSADDIQTYCAQSWETRRSGDGLTECNPCHRRDAFN